MMVWQAQINEFFPPSVVNMHPKSNHLPLTHGMVLQLFPPDQILVHILVLTEPIVPLNQALEDFRVNVSKLFLHLLIFAFYVLHLQLRHRLLE